MSIFLDLNNKLIRLKRRACKKGVLFDIDDIWLMKKLNQGYCEATGIRLDISSKPFVNPFYPTIDRVDAKKGYTKDNCKMVCFMYNNAKCEFDEEVFAYWAKHFVKQYEKRNST